MSPAAKPFAERIKIELPATQCSGIVQAFIVCAKTGETVKTFPRQKNLILDQGLDRLATRRWNQMLTAAAAGTGTTPTKDLVNGTMSRTGATCTLTGSTYDLTSGDIGKWIKWDDGTQAKITAVGSTTSCTTAQSGTVADQPVVALFRANQVGLATETKRSTTYPDYQEDDLTWSNTTLYDEATSTMILRRTWDFSAEVSPQNYTEIGISDTASSGNNLFSRILLDGVVAVAVDQQLRIRYELSITTAPAIADNGDAQPDPFPITGWPRPYAVTGIVSTGSDFTVTLGETHHYVAGGKINLAGVKKPRFTLTAASSTGSDFTLTTSASHGLTSGDTIIVEGVSPSGYNGEWVCTTGTTGSTIVVTSSANPGTGTVFGNVRMKEPTTWYDGEWTIASVTGTTVVVTSALNLGTAAEGTAVNNLAWKGYRVGWGIQQLRGNNLSGWIDPGIAAGRTANAFDMYFSPGNSTGEAQPGHGLFDPERPNIEIVSRTDGAPTAPTFSQTSDLTANSWYSAVAGSWGTTAVIANPSASTKSSYTNGDFFHDHTVTILTGNLNGSDIRWLGISAPIGGSARNRHAYYNIFFDERQRKDSTHRLVLTIRIRWDRTLG